MLSRTSCPLCQATADVVLVFPYTTPAWQEWVSTHPLTDVLRDQSYCIRFCATCDFHFQEMVPDNHEASRLYASAAVAPGFHPLSGDQQSRLTHEIRLLRHLLPGRPPRVLDYGLGAGDWLKTARALDCECWGTDLHPAATALTQGLGAQFVSPDQLPEKIFDYLNADQVLEHISDPLALVQQWHRALRSGGFLKISTPGDRTMADKIAALRFQHSPTPDFLQKFDALSPLLHVNLFTAGSLIRLASRAGFRLVRISPLVSWSILSFPRSGRQWNEAIYGPIKRWRARGTWQYFQKS